MARGKLAARGKSATRPNRDKEAPDSSHVPVPPFFNTTFSTHRVSPLYVGTKQLTPTRLDHLAHRLRDALVGDVVRGIQIGLEAIDTPVGQVGPLKAVEIRWFQAEAVLGASGRGTGNQDGGVNEQNLENDQGLWIELRHENATYVALLLPGSPGSSTGVPSRSEALPWTMQPGNSSTQALKADQGRFLHLPLLLLRMPLPLKGIVSDWLSTTFDCRVSKLALGTKPLIAIWEGWIQEVGLPSNGPDFILTLAFNAPLTENHSASNLDSGVEVDGGETEATEEPGLRTIDITISPPDLSRFVRAGKADGPWTAVKGSWDTDPRERRRLAGGNADDGWAWRVAKDGQEHPFTEALAHYLDHHLALKLFHPSVRVVQISCGGFVLAQSRLKIVKVGDVTDNLSRAAWMFVAKLAERIQGEAWPSVV